MFINNVPAFVNGTINITNDFTTQNNVVVSGVGTIVVGGLTTISNNSTVFELVLQAVMVVHLFRDVRITPTIMFGVGQ